MFRTTTAAFVLMVLAFVVPGQAADRDKSGVDDAATVANGSAAVGMAGDVDWSREPVKFGAPSRGAVLPSLYASLAALNAFDAYTTSKGLALGASEANPMMRAVAGRPAVLWAVKGGVTAGSVFIADRLWKKNNKVGAIAVMLATNGMMATVAARNASVIRQHQVR